VEQSVESPRGDAPVDLRYPRGVGGPATQKLCILGEMQLWKGGELSVLPPSRKTRALLAYLVVTGRAHRRERLSDLFWDVADDRRGALRWSLSKLRGLVDDDEVTRLVTDRESVELVRRGLEVDLLRLREALGAKSVADVPTETLEELAALHRGEPLEGLDLPDFDEYQAWCIGERERARALRISLLRELTQRASHEPARAVEHARAWVLADPLDELARASLLRLLGAAGLREEARQVYESGRRIEQELGRRGSGELADAWKSLEAAPARGGASRAASSQEAASDVPLVGRDRELAALAELAEASRRDRELAVVLVTGEPGVGKTRLLSAFRASGKATGIAGASFEADSGKPYAPWIDALRGASPDDRAARSLELVDALGSGVFSAGPRDRERFFGTVAEAIDELASRAPPASVVFDDAQWMDDGSAALRHHVTRACAKSPVVVVLSARSGELEDNGGISRLLRGLRRDGRVREIPLAPLDADETARLVRAVRADADAARIHAQSAGNPLLSLELARAGDGAAAGTLGALVRDRLAQLPNEAADVLRWGAVLGDGFSAEDVDALAAMDLDAIVGALETLEKRALVTRDARPPRHGGTAFAFAHDIVRRVVYADLSEPRRRLMHKRAAVELTKRGGADAGEIAHHAVLAHDAAMAASACLSAAHRSLRLFANADAYALARRGIRHAENLADPERTRSLLELHEVALSAHRPEDASTLAAQIEELSERALDLGALQHARLGFHLLGYLSWETGDWQVAKRHMLQAEAASRGASEQERVLGMAEAARCLLMIERDLPHAHALVREAAARADKAGLSSPPLHDARGMLELHLGNLDIAAAELERARTLAHANRDRQDEFSALEHLVVLELRRGAHAAALRHAEELARLGEKFREGSEAPFARALVAVARIASGDEGAHAALDAEVDALTAADAKHRLAFVLTRAAHLDVQRGSVDRSCRRAAQALAVATALGRPTEIAFARYVLLCCAKRRGDADAAHEHGEALAALPLAAVSADVKKLVEEEA